MKKNIWMSLVVVIAMTMMTACSSDSDSDDNNGGGGAPQNPFITTWQIADIGIDDNVSFNTADTTGTFTIDWGDGDVQDVTNHQADSDNPLTHHYSEDGNFTVKITGDFHSITQDRVGKQLLSVDNWGDIEWTSMRGAFSGCHNMEYKATDTPDLSNVTDMYSMFSFAYKFNGDIGNWDTSNVTNMSNMFSYNWDFNQNIAHWDTSKVTDMALMFYDAEQFNQDIAQWDTSNVTDISYMFQYAFEFDQNISEWDVSSVMNNRRFDDNTSSGWEASEKPAWSTAAFHSYITTWKIPEGNKTVTLSTKDANGTYTVNWGDGTEEDHFVIEGTSVDDPTHTYAEPGDYQIKITGDLRRIYNERLPHGETRLISIDNWGDIEWTNMDSSFANCPNMVYNATDVPDLSNVITMKAMFQKSPLFNGGIGDWNTSNVESMLALFDRATTFNRDISGWDVSNVTNMDSLFTKAKAFNQPLADWNVSNVTDMEYMFNHTDKFNQSLVGWDVSSVTNMCYMFNNTKAFDQNISDWDVSSVTNMRVMFYGMDNFDQNISKWNVSSVTDMHSMFESCSSFNQDISDWNTSNVTDMHYMFFHAGVFDQNISKWNTSSVTTMLGMFNSATAFDQNISKWDVTKVTKNTGFDEYTSADWICSEKPAGFCTTNN